MGAYRIKQSIYSLLAMTTLTGLIGLSGCQKKVAAEDQKEPGLERVAVETVPVEIRPMETTVLAQGTLSPGQGASVRVAPFAAGRLLTVRVREGEHVAAGQVVAVQDNRPQLAQARSAAAAVSSSQALAAEATLAARATETDQQNSVRLARLTLASTRLDRENNVQQAQTALTAAQTDLQKTRAGARPQEVAQAEQAVTQARATRDRAVSEEEREKFLFEKGISAKKQWEDAQTALAIANSALESAQQQANLVKAGARSEDLRAAEIREQQARETLAQAKRSGDAKIAQAQAALRQAEQGALQIAVKRQDARAQQETVLQRQADLAAAQQNAQYAEIRAPISGIVTRRAMNPGDMADPANAILEIADTSQLNLLASLPAEEGLKVRTGMPAKVTTDTSGHTAPARILSVGTVDPQTNLLSVRLGVSNPGNALRVGLFASAAIILHTTTRAMTVPKQAVVTREGKSVLFVVRDGEAHEKEVTLGAEENGTVEIATGVAQGDKVIRLGQYELADGAKVTEQEKEPEKEAGAKEGKP